MATYYYSLGVLHTLDENRMAAIKSFEKAFTYDPLSRKLQRNWPPPTQKQETSKGLLRPAKKPCKIIRIPPISI